MKQFFATMFICLRPYWPWVAFIFFAIAVQMSFRLAVPFAFQQTFDTAIPQQDLSYLIQLIGILCVWWLLQAGLSLAQDIRAAKIGFSAINDLRIEMFDRLSASTVDYFSRNKTGDVIARFSVDFLSIEKAATQSIYIFIFSCLNVLASVGLLFYIDWRLALMTLLGIVLSAIAPKRLSKRAETKSYQRKTYEGTLTTYIQETLRTFETIQAFNLWGFTKKGFKQALAAFELKAMDAATISSIVSRLGSQSAFLLQVLILALGGYLVIDGNLSVGALVAFLALLQNMVAATSHLANSMPDLIEAAGASRRITEYLADTKAAGEDPKGKELPRLIRRVAFEEVVFKYNDDAPVLNHVSFEINKGESIAIVGPSGSGKSSVLKLLLRFYEPNSGRIKWDDEDVQVFSGASLREQISIVPQDSVLFDSSIRENIRMGRLEANDADIVAAAKDAELHAMIIALPQGYDTPVGELGSHLSGGQRQRVAIARAIVRDPVLLVLDEATSALDPITERAINDTLMRVSRQRTLIAVTHRLHTIIGVDRILVMQQGRIVQQGKHDELLNQSGLYADLWQKQTGFTVSDDGLRAECSPQRLKMIPIFADIDIARLTHLSSLLVSEYFPNGRTVFNKGDLGDKFYVIANGQVEVSELVNEETRSLDFGDFFGEVALMEQTTRTATVTTAMPTLFLTLTRQQFQNLLADAPELQEVMKNLAHTRDTRKT